METTLSTYLSAELDRRGWNYRELARRSGVSHATISNIVSGIGEPTPLSCRKIATAFGVPAETVYQLAGILPEYGDLLPEVKNWNGRLLGLKPTARARALLAMAGVLELAEALEDHGSLPLPGSAG